MRRLLPALLLCPALAAAVTPADLSYLNARFGYRVAVPADLRAQRAPDNGDGQAWISRDGRAQVTVWGSFAPGALQRETAAQWADDHQAADARAGARQTYRRVLKDSFVQSGFLSDGRIFYRRVLVRSGTEAGLLVTYPASQRREWDARAARMAASLRWIPR